MFYIYLLLFFVISDQKDDIENGMYVYESVD